MTKPKAIRLLGVRMLTDETVSADVRRLLYTERYERGEARLFLMNWEPDDVVMEVGAGIGFISTLCSLTLGSQRVVSYEANPLLLERTRHTYELNGVSPELVHGVLGEGRGEVPFYLRDSFLESSLEEQPGTRRVTVPQLDVTEEMRRVRPTFVIMDVEGYEGALVPMIDWTGVRKIVMEVHHPELGQEGVRSLYAHLERAGLRRDSGISSKSKAYFYRVTEAPASRGHGAGARLQGAPRAG